MFELVKKISEIKQDVVFIGSFAELLNNYNVSVNDIDIVVLDLEGLDFLGEIEKFQTFSAFSTSKKRGYIKRSDFNIDIFIEEELPEYFNKENIKICTKKGMISYYENLLLNVDVSIKHIIENKLKFLKSE